MEKKDLLRSLLSIIKLHWSWWIAFVLITYSFNVSFKSVYGANSHGGLFYGAITAFFILASILIHEMAHAVTAMSRGVKVSSIRVFFFGGIAEFDREIDNADSEILVSAAGPAASLLMAIGFFMLKGNIMSDNLMRIQLFIAGLNLIPVFPLDGGKILRSILWKYHYKDYIKATAAALNFSSVAATGFLLLAVPLMFLKSVAYAIWLIFIGLLVKAAVSANRTLIPWDIENKPVSDLMIPREGVISVNEDCTIEDFLNKYFLIYGFHGYPVTESGNKDTLKGIVSYWHVRRLLKAGSISLKQTVSEVMLAVSGYDDRLPCIYSDAPVGVAFQKMVFNNYSRLLVFDRGSNTYTGLLVRSSLNRQSSFLTGREEHNQGREVC